MSIRTEDLQALLGQMTDEQGDEAFDMLGSDGVPIIKWLANQMLDAASVHAMEKGSVNNLTLNTTCASITSGIWLGWKLREMEMQRQLQEV